MTNETTAEFHRQARENIAATLAAMREETGRETTPEVVEAMVGVEAQRLLYRSEHPTSSAPRKSLSGPLPLAGLLPKHRSSAPAELPPPSYGCAVCEDAGIVQIQNDSIAPERVLARDPVNGKVVVACWGCEPVTRRARMLHGELGGADLLRSTFERYQATTNDESMTLAQVRRWAARDDARPFLLLSGSVGVGKSHLAKAAAIWMAEHGYRVTFRTARGILSEIKASFDHTLGEPSTAEVEWRFQNAGVLVVDDLGAEYVTAWGASSLEGLLMVRYERELLTIITSNNDLAGIADAQADRHGRLVSRLSDVMRTSYLEMSGEDWRSRVR